MIETTFKDETETDLFGEQAVLCGGISELVRAGYETLVEAGYDPQLAYFECLHELKLIVDLMYEKGIAGMRYSISNTAEYGDITRGKRDHRRRDAPGDERRSSARSSPATFAREWIAEIRAGQENFQRMREEQAGHQIEREGKELRSMMAWIDDGVRRGLERLCRATPLAARRRVPTDDPSHGPNPFTKQFLMTAGPTPVPPQVSRRWPTPMLYHRAPAGRGALRARAGDACRRSSGPTTTC